MTPLAQHILRCALGEKSGADFWRGNAKPVIDAMTGAQFFEVTEAIQICEAIRDGGLLRADESGNCQQISDTAFLPAEKTWMEFRLPDTQHRIALFAEDMRNGQARITAFFDIVCNHLGSVDIFGDGYTIREGKHYFPVAIVPETLEDHERAKRGYLALVHMLLLIINTPKLIGRRQHMPHRGLEKRLLAKRKTLGNFPLQAWTEIKLEITPPRDASGDGTHEAHLTGERALHFCRAHLRVRRGRIEHVRGHWRGDASLGVKRSRYTLVAPK